MTGHSSGVSAARLVASGLARVLSGYDGAITPMLGRHGRVFLY